MGPAQKSLFGDFPRAVGVTTPEWSDGELRQYMVHSEMEMDTVIEQVAGERNLYSSVCSFAPVRSGGVPDGSAVVADKVSYDFDSSAKGDHGARWDHPLIPGGVGDKWVAEAMQSDPDVREAVLGDVCSEVQQLAEASLSADIPLFAVFSGFGVHVHQLFEETYENAAKKLKTTCRKWVDDLSLDLVDPQASGQTVRIMRMPNVERIIHSSEAIQSGIFTVPLHGEELLEITPKSLVRMSREPRNVSGFEGQKPELTVHSGYSTGMEDGDIEMKELPDRNVDDEFVEYLVRDVVKLPCVAERAMGPDPAHPVRVKVAVHFLMAGFTPEEIADFIARLNWKNFDRETTLYQIKTLRESGKGDWSCKTMKNKGLCVKNEIGGECEMEGYTGGNSFV